MAIEWEGLPAAAVDFLQRLVKNSIPLRCDQVCSPEAAKVARLDPLQLFGGARDPAASMSGLMLFLGCWKASHELSQDNAARNGSYWHAIAHRIEPDTPNAGYWFRRVGEHPTFPELYRRTQAILSEGEFKDLGWQLGARWEPERFLAWCEEARSTNSAEATKAAITIQDAECRLLLRWCAEPKDCFR